jgi:hypothetical protein
MLRNGLELVIDFILLRPALQSFPTCIRALPEFRVDPERLRTPKVNPRHIVLHCYHPVGTTLVGLEYCCSSGVAGPEPVLNQVSGLVFGRDWSWLLFMLHSPMVVWPCRPRTPQVFAPAYAHVSPVPIRPFACAACPSARLARYSKIIPSKQSQLRPFDLQSTRSGRDGGPTKHGHLFFRHLEQATSAKAASGPLSLLSSRILLLYSPGS